MGRIRSWARKHLLFHFIKLIHYICQIIYYFIFMQKLYFFFIVLSLFSCSQKSKTDDKQIQSNPSQNSATENFGTTGDSSTTILNIRAEYQRIKSDSAKNKHVFLEADCSGFAGSIDFQVENDKVRRIVYSSGSDHGGSTEEYYLRGDSLLFVFIEDGGWMFDVNSKDPENPSTIDESIETRIYFEQEKVIKALHKQAKGPTKDIFALMAKAKNENLANENGEKWLKNLQELKQVLKTKRFEAYLCK